MRFHAPLELNGRSATGFEVPAAIVEQLAAGRRPPVTVTLNGTFSYRSTVASMGGRFMVPVSADVRAAAGVAAGDDLDVEIVHDAQPRTVEVPPDLAAAIAAEPELQAVWDRLAYTHRREHVEAVASAKKPETRERRVAKAIEMLQAKA